MTHRLMPGGQKVGDENKQQQPIDDQTYQCRCEYAFRPMLANAKQGNGTQTQTYEDEH